MRSDFRSILVKEFKALYRYTRKNTLEFNEKCIECSKELVILHYGKEQLNLDEIWIWAEIPEGSRSFPGYHCIRCGNLYSYLLVNDICIPYSDWVYDDSYMANDGWYYSIDRKTGIGTRFDNTLILAC